MESSCRDGLSTVDGELDYPTALPRPVKAQSTEMREKWLYSTLPNFAMQKKQGKIDEKVFAETRLRRGAYGQRYDNGQRHDGTKTQKLPYPPLTKGPDTFWDAPGMQRIKIPYGGLNPQQMVALAELAEEYSD